MKFGNKSNFDFYSNGNVKTMDDNHSKELWSTNQKEEEELEIQNKLDG